MSIQHIQITWDDYVALQTQIGKLERENARLRKRLAEIEYIGSDKSIIFDMVFPDPPQEAQE